MAREPFGVGSYVHVYNRGVKKLPIYREKEDLLRLLLNLYYFNHTDRMPDNWTREIEGKGYATHPHWPETWKEQEPIVAVLGFSIMPNHVHLMLKEVVEGGVSKFMHKVSMAYSKYINEKYDESGSLFQGTFKSRLVESDADFKNLAVYVMVKNPFELFPGGLRLAIEQFDDAYEKAINDPLNSLGVYAGARATPIISPDLLGELFETPESFKEFARESMLYRLDQLNEANVMDT
ncbi:MAG: transposase [Patescibacteria group bacterium]